MYLHKQKKPNGDIYLSIKEKYHVPKVGAREKTVESIGYVSALKEKYDDPVAFFTQKAVEMTEQKKKDRSRTMIYDPDEEMEIGTDDVKNLGYGILKRLYKDLEIDRFWNWKTRNRSLGYSVDKIFRLLVFSRVLSPASKKVTYENRGIYFEDFGDFSLDDIYNALDVIHENQEDLQKWIFDRSDRLCPRDLSVAYFDCTNYYFDIGRPDVDTLDDIGNPVDKNGDPVAPRYRKRGPEKNHRPDPIVEMGLLTDRNGIPLAFDLFPGNESEKVHMRPLINRVKNEFADSRIIFVADRGLNTSDNIYYINGDNKGDVNLRDGYVYGQSVRGADAEFKTWVLSGGYQKDKTVDEYGQQIFFVHKSRIYPKELHVNVTKPGQKKPVKKTVRIDQKQMAYYSEKYAKKQRADREAMVARAMDLIAHPKKYDRVTSKGSASYVRNIAFDKETGEILEGAALVLDMEKIEEEQKYDGYYSVVTSELEMPDREMRDIYRGLAQIEDAFKITKSDFSSQPVFVRTNEHIDAHFTTCFTSLVLIRMLQAMLGKKFPVSRIINSMKKYCCVPFDTNVYKLTYYDEIIDEYARLMEIKLKGKFPTRQEIQRFLRY